MIKNIIDFFHSTKWIYVICFLTLGLEIYLVLSLFYNLPNSINTQIYWTIVSAVICSVELFVIIQIKINYNSRKWGRFIGYTLSYVVTLAVLFLAALGYNLKAIEGKAQIENINAMQNISILSEISNNELAIMKYNSVIAETNNMYIVERYRNMINDLNDNDRKLYAKIQPETNNNLSKDKDAFALISEKTGLNRNFIIFWFLSGVWAILAMIMFITAPGGQQLKSESIIDLTEENNVSYILNRWSLFQKWIKLLPSNDFAISKQGITRGTSKRFREILGSIYSITNDKKTQLYDTEKGILNFQAGIIIKALQNKLGK